jgi:hypothetical protein
MLKTANNSSNQSVLTALNSRHKKTRYVEQITTCDLTIQTENSAAKMAASATCIRDSVISVMMVV